MILKNLKLFFLFLLSQQAFGQMANLLDSTIFMHGTPLSYVELDYNQSQDDIETATLEIPLGPKAQILRSKTYTCGQNEGSGLWIKYNQEIYLYKNQKLYLSKSDVNEIASKQLDKKVKRLLKGLNMLVRKSDYAKNIIQTLQQSENRFTISIVPTTNSYALVPLPKGRFGVLNNNAYAFQVLETHNLVVDYAAFDRIGSGAEIRWKSSDNIIKLAHELSHAYDANFGLLDDRLTKINGMTMSVREIRALYHENMIRSEMNKSYRVKVTSGRALIAGNQPFTHPLPYLARH